LKKKETLAIHHLAVLMPNVGNVTEQVLVSAYQSILETLTLDAGLNV